MANFTNTPITKEDFKKIDSISDMKNMIERINQRSLELDKLMKATGYGALEDELNLIDYKRRYLERIIKETDDLAK